ncbi:pilus assembly FimT family protein [Dyella mobilis]|uniref:Type II secretion system protein H n=1 Tax=Dyella mobilis TaxID=1849582 RepID=A0ABS2KME1_9GAMM|nr:GspH/FimT family pseudopilin [Dyella mobilis]MBM7132043.1 GspH/FimT family pseudopilin [Dyella mobilis]
MRRFSRASSKPCRGFTLIELLVTMVIGVVLLMYAIPNFIVMVNNYRLTTTANDMVAALNLARMEAVKTNADTQFCSDSSSNNQSDKLGSACSALSQPAGAVVTKVPSSSSSTTTVQTGEVGLTSPVQLHGDITAVRFTPLGIGYVAGTTTPVSASSTSPAVADICNSSLSTNNHIKVVMTGGTIVSTSFSSGTCP